MTQVERTRARVLRMLNVWGIKKILGRDVLSLVQAMPDHFVRSQLMLHSHNPAYVIEAVAAGNGLILSSQQTQDTINN